MRDLELINRARKMRSEMTEPETRLWLQLRAKRFQSIKFRRQKVIQDDKQRYIVDFAANDPKLVIELDGDTHADQQRYDERRTAFLNAQNYKVVRFKNTDINMNMESVLEKLVGVIEELRARPPLPTLSPEGERAL